MVQHVQSAAQVEGHTLDVIMQAWWNASQPDPPTLSDHSFIVGQLDATSLASVNPVPSVRRRCWQSFYIDIFSLDLRNTVSVLMKLPPPSESEVDDWFAVYDQSTISCERYLINMHRWRQFIQDDDKLLRDMTMTVELPKYPWENWKSVTSNLKNKQLIH